MLSMVKWGVPTPVILLVLLLTHNTLVPGEQDWFAFGFASVTGIKSRTLQDRDFCEIYAGKGFVSSALREAPLFVTISTPCFVAPWSGRVRWHVIGP